MGGRVVVQQQPVDVRRQVKVKVVVVVVVRVVILRSCPAECAWMCTTELWCLC